MDKLRWQDAGERAESAGVGGSARLVEDRGVFRSKRSGALLSQSHSARNSKAQKNLPSKKAKQLRRRQAIDRAMESLESRMMLTVTGFQLPLNYGTGVAPIALVQGDFNADGKTDLAVANHQDNTISLLAGDGHGGFTTAHTYGVNSAPHVGTGPNAIIAGDFNGDHHLDLATSDTGGGVSVLLSDGHGGFAT